MRRETLDPPNAMVFVKIILAGATIVALLAIGQREQWFERAGVVGGCEVIATPFGQKGQWWSCREGVLTGYPSLVRQNCDVTNTTQNRQYWHCPQPIERPSAL